MRDIHLAMGIAVMSSNLLAGGWGAIAWYLRKPTVGFWYALRVAQAAVVIQVAIGGVLVLLGNEPPDGLHYVYGLLPLLVTLLAEGSRSGMADRELEGLDFDAQPRSRQAELAAAIARNEMGVMALSALIVFLLALRAGFTSGGL